jgi:thymidylate kinase
MTRSLTSEEQRFFLDYFAALDMAGISNAIARNAAGFPLTMGNDIDLLIPRARAKDAWHIFTRLLSKYTGTLWQKNSREFVLDLRFSLLSSKLPLHLDLYWGVFTWHGIPYLDEVTALHDAKVADGFRFVRPAHEAIGMFCASLLWGSFYKEKYGELMRNVFADPVEGEELAHQLTLAFGPAPLPFQPGSRPEPSVDSARIAACELRKRLKHQSFRKAPFRTLLSLGRYWLTEILTTIKPQGVTVAVMGPDGSGKSTAIQLVENRMKHCFVRVKHYHFRPAVLPDPGVVIGSRSRHTGPVTDPHGKPPHKIPIAIARLAWFALDFWLGHLLRVRRHRSLSELVLFDRHAADLFCDPLRYRFALPDWFLKLVVKCIPRPQMTFVLICDAATITQRKGELPSTAIQGILSSYRKFAQTGAIEIDATKDADDVASQIESQILDFMKARHPLFTDNNPPPK